MQRADFEAKDPVIAELTPKVVAPEETQTDESTSSPETAHPPNDQKQQLLEDLKRAAECLKKIEKARAEARAEEVQDAKAQEGVELAVRFEQTAESIDAFKVVNAYFDKKMQLTDPNSTQGAETQTEGDADSLKQLQDMVLENKKRLSCSPWPIEARSSDQDDDLEVGELTTETDITKVIAEIKELQKRLEDKNYEKFVENEWRYYALLSENKKLLGEKSALPAEITKLWVAYILVAVSNAICGRNDDCCTRGNLALRGEKNKDFVHEEKRRGEKDVADVLSRCNEFKDYATATERHELKKVVEEFEEFLKYYSYEKKEQKKIDVIVEQLKETFGLKSGKGVISLFFKEMQREDLSSTQDAEILSEHSVDENESLYRWWPNYDAWAASGQDSNSEEGGSLLTDLNSTRNAETQTEWDAPAESSNEGKMS